MTFVMQGVSVMRVGITKGLSVVLQLSGLEFKVTGYIEIRSFVFILILIFKNNKVLSIDLSSEQQCFDCMMFISRL